jgi:predicted pyridoxine 5'-phosphate oxidase superfamily flavin-nucleotide-binding protein
MNTKQVSDIAFSPAVKEAQRQRGSREIYEKMGQRGSWNEEVNEMLADFIAQRDSLYLGTASAEGRPYIQHRGGPKGFVKVLDPKTLAFADYSGNRQYISVGNLGENDRAFLFLMDYPNRTRVKIWGRARFVEDDPDLLATLMEDDYKAKPERALVFHLEVWDVNCRQHIQERHTPEELENALEPLRRRIAELEEENAALKARDASVGA